MEARRLSGLCASCRHVVAELQRYTAQPWDVSFACGLRNHGGANWIKAPHANSCARYEREPGAD